jgi:hypothetical protein
MKDKETKSKSMFMDNTFSLAKGIHHINIAKQYFEDISIGTSYDVKMIFNQYIQKCEYIISNVKNRLSDENRAILAQELEDSLSFDAIADKIIRLSIEQRAFVEEILDSMIRGEEIIITDDKNN